MKKILIAVLAFVYIFVCTGLAINIHYCMGKPAYVDLNDQKDKCVKCGMKSTANSCCKHTYKIIKLNDTHELAGNIIKLFSPLTFLNNIQSAPNNDLSFPKLITSFHNNSPPGFTGTPLYIKNCVFRI